MILGLLEEDFHHQEIKPSILLLSCETYYELLKGERAMDTCFRIDKSGRLGIKISGCSTFVVDFLGTSYQWLT